MKKVILILISILICTMVGFISSRFQIDALSSWYPTLNKSSLNPPNWVFPVAWTILYILMGISIALIIYRKEIDISALIGLFVGQLILNFMWSIIFFYFQKPTLALFDLILLIMINIVFAFKAWHVSKISSILFIPYIFWICFAGYLNAYIVLYN